MTTQHPAASASGTDLDAPLTALAAIQNRLGLTYNLCLSLAPKQAVGELLDVAINMPEWQVVHDAIARRATHQPSEADEPTYMTQSQAFDWAWKTLKGELGAERWKAGEEVQSWAFFKYGWDHRGQYQKQREAALAHRATTATVDCPECGFGQEHDPSCPCATTPPEDAPVPRYALEAFSKQLAEVSKRNAQLEALAAAYGPKSLQYDIEHPNDGLNSTDSAEVERIMRGRATTAEHTTSDAVRIAKKQMADSKLAGPGVTAHERYLHVELEVLQRAVIRCASAERATTAEQQAAPVECGDMTCAGCVTNEGPCKYETRCANCPYAAPTWDHEADDTTPAATTASARPDDVYDFGSMIDPNASHNMRKPRTTTASASGEATYTYEQAQRHAAEAVAADRLGRATAPSREATGLDEWRVGEFWSSANPGKKVLMLSPADRIESDGNHKDFVRWVVGSRAALAQQSAAPGARCPHCDGTGDVHRADGEWSGECSCTAAQAQAGEGDARERVRDAVAQALTGVYYCDRAWSAWGVGTMSEDDFTPAAEVGDILSEIADAAIAAMAAQPNGGDNA